MIHSYNTYCNFTEEIQDNIGLFFALLLPSFSPDWMLKAGFVIVLIIKVFSKWKCIAPEDFIS